MSEEVTEATRGRRQNVSLANLYLDPNNFRFVDNPKYHYVAREDVFKPEVQRMASMLVSGKSQEDIQDLIASFKENGWLDIDPILVERRESGRYLVIEGNRRVAALKHFQRQYQGGAGLGKLDPAMFSKVPVVLHDRADGKQHLVMMGLHHISGKRRWPAINRALAMKQLQDQFDGDADAACRALGVTKQDFNRSVRTLALVGAYKESDYGDQFKSDQYTLFREVLGKPALRTWLGWDNATSAAKAKHNLDRLFSWMSYEDPSDENAIDPRIEMGPVITNLPQISELARVISDPVAVERLDETRSLQEATLSSNLLVKTEIERAFGSCENGIAQLNRRVGELDSEDLDRVEQLIGKLHGVAMARKRRPAIFGERMAWQPFNELTRSQFSVIQVDQYRGIDGLALDDLRRVNLIAGANNAGKTSLLEAIYLLAHQNDETALLDIHRWRGRVEGELDPAWLVRQIQSVVHLSGRFDDVPDNAVALEMQRLDEPGSEIKDQQRFLAKLAVTSHYGTRKQTAEVALFSESPPRTTFQGRHWLCRSALTSSYWTNRLDTLVKANEAALATGTKAKVIDFIKGHVDSHLNNIELVDEHRRFLVSHQDYERAPDLASFGDGLRRVFEIGLLFASVRGGVLLIDEFENAIHPQLLVEFTRNVQELAKEHNVQVFLTTHSKEALDAFLQNDYATSDIAGYALCRGDDGIRVRRFGGEKLTRLHKALDFDLRGMV